MNRLVGGVDRNLYPEPGDTTVASINVDRGLVSGKLDTVGLTEAGLAQIVSDGAAILARLATDRAAVALGRMPMPPDFFDGWTLDAVERANAAARRKLDGKP